MSTVRRDALLAAVSGTFFLGALAVLDATETVLDPVAISVGVASALLVEAAFVLDTPAAEWWTRQRIQGLSVTVLLVSVAVVAWWVGPVAIAAACWGLATYFVLLLVVLTGYWPAESGQTGH